MDSLTQALLGAGTAALLVPAAHHRRALVLGAVLGTLPDLDVLIPYADAVDVVTRHRSFSHSLLVLPFVGLAVWWLARWRWAVVRDAPGRWLLAIELALITHPLLDACTVYGTQLFWPFEPPPAMGSGVFIIDPLYTLPWLVAVLVAWLRPLARRASFALAAAALSSTLYLAWGLLAGAHLEQTARRALASLGEPESKVLAIPTPFNTVLWRVIAVSPGGDYREGYYSFLAPEAGLTLKPYPSARHRLGAVAQSPAVRRLDWFTHGFWSAQDVDGELIVTDLRMGAEPDYLFRYVVGRREGDGPARPLTPVERAPVEADAGARLAEMWQRIFAPAG